MSLFRLLVQVIMAISTVRSTFLCCFFALRGNTDMLWEAGSRGCQYPEKNKQAVMSSPFRSDNSWNVTWHTLLEYYPTASLGAIGWVLTFSFHGLVHEGECASCHTSGNPKINVASGFQPSSPLNWKWDLFPSQLSPRPILDGLMDRMYHDRSSTYLPVIIRYQETDLLIYLVFFFLGELFKNVKKIKKWLIHPKLSSIRLNILMKCLLLQESNISEICVGKQAKSEGTAVRDLSFLFVREWNTWHKAITLLCTAISCFLE